MIKRTLLGFILTALALLGLPGIASAQTGPASCGEDEHYFIFQYNFGVDGDVVDEGCWPKNDVFRNDVSPPLIASKLHISCSDTITNGVPEKGDLGDPDRRIVAYHITKKDGKTCGFGTPISAGGVLGLLLVTGTAGLVGVAQLRKRRQPAM